MQGLAKTCLWLAIVAQLALSQVSIAHAAATERSLVKWHSDIKVAGQEATRLGKPILVQMTAPWCGYCHKMLRETYSDPEVAKQVNEFFVPLLLDADANPQAVEILAIDSFPSTVIISPQFKERGRMTGFVKSADFKKKLAPFCKPASPAPVEAKSLISKTSKSDLAESAVAAASASAPRLPSIEPQEFKLPEPAASVSTKGVSAALQLPLPSTESIELRAPKLPELPNSKSVLSNRVERTLAARPEFESDTVQTAAAQPEFADSEPVGPAEKEPTEKATGEDGLVLPKSTRLPEPSVSTVAAKLTEMLEEEDEDEPVKTTPQLPLAFNGMCLVSMLRVQEVTPGKAQFEEISHGVRLQFASAQDLAAFRKNPEAYWPLLDGHCPVARAYQEKNVNGDPETSGLYQGKLVFFRDEAHRDEFMKAPRKLLRTAQENQVVR